MIYQSPIGPLYLTADGGCLTGLYLERPEGFRESDAPVILQAARQLDDYFAGRLQRFDLPLRPAGTDFERRVWQALTTIPYGQTRSYRDIAQQVGCPGGMRAVGNANSKNPISVIIPCHRVIAANHTLGGYSGGLDKKRYLLKLEGAVLVRS